VLFDWYGFLSMSKLRDSGPLALRTWQLSALEALVTSLPLTERSGCGWFAAMLMEV
jgi:hypothetical protein